MQAVGSIDVLLRQAAADDNVEPLVESAVDGDTLVRCLSESLDVSLRDSRHPSDAGQPQLRQSSSGSGELSRR